MAHAPRTNAAETAVERAQTYNQFFFPGGTPTRYLDTVITPGLRGTRQLLTVLPGVLYRGGGPGGKQPLSMSTLTNLCETGFSLAVYSYDEGYSNPGVIRCTNRLTGQPNSLRYLAGRILDKKFKARFLAEVKEVAENPDLGPVFVHCWNGMHASGEFAAVALRQMCEWDGATASAYWLRHAGGFALISRINSFKPSSDLSISADAQAAICEQRR